MKNKIYNLNISFLRFIFCIAVLLYHLNILKGGYLAVCSFLVLSGYFSTVSLYKNGSLISYYMKRIKKIYIPLIITVFTTVTVLGILNMNIFNFKSEITSILLGYNNYFQINANIDYFAKNINSPFTHLWYIAILLQIELIFPLILSILKKLGNKISKCIPLIFMTILSIGGAIYFYYTSKTSNITITYYDTISRLFSFTFGSTLALYRLNISNVPKHKLRKLPTSIMFFIYLILLIVLFITIPSSSKLFSLSMIITTIITLKLVECATILFNKNKVFSNQLIKFISDISYEIYLVQYPIIYLLVFIKLPFVLNILITIILTILISYLIHISISDKKSILLKILFILLIIYGSYRYLMMKDTKKEINELKDTLNSNQEIMKKKQEEYLKTEDEKKEEIEKEKIINEEQVMNYITNLKVVGIGDSIMLNTVDTFYETFPNGYFDALKNRTICASYDVLNNIKNSGVRWDVLIFNLGTNGEPNRKCKENLRELAGDSQIFWLTATNPDVPENNPDLINYANEFDNIHILDWPSEANKHPEYLYSDNTHLRPEATKPYVEFVKNGIYNYYLENPDKIK